MYSNKYFKLANLKSVTHDSLFTIWVLLLEYWYHAVGYDVMCFIIHPCDPTVVICYLIRPCDIAVCITYLISHSYSLTYNLRTRASKHQL